MVTGSDSESDAEREASLMRNFTLETATRVAWQSHFGMRLQLERLRALEGKDPGDGEFLADMTTLIIALWRLRLAGSMSVQIEGKSSQLRDALDAFDAALPGLAKLRHVTLHYDNYALENAARKNTVGTLPRLIGARDLWILERSKDGFTWLEVTLNYDTAELAAGALYAAIQDSNNGRLGHDLYSNRPDIPVQVTLAALEDAQDLEEAALQEAAIAAGEPTVPLGEVARELGIDLD